jgi:hypothetical protein
MMPSTRTLRFAAAVCTLALGASAVGCRDTLLQVQHPDILTPVDLNSSDGAEGLRVGAIGRLASMTAGDESSWLYGGLMVDEWRSSDTFIQRDQADSRTIDAGNSFVAAAFRGISRARVASYQAIGPLRQYRPAAVASVGQMFFVKGFAEMQAASDFCNGIPFADLSTATPAVGSPVSVAQAFTMAVASFDSALANAGTDATVINSAKIGKARALLGLGKLPEAATAVTGVPTNFSYDMTFTPVKQDNYVWTIANSLKRYSVQDAVDATGTIPNALPFVSAADPRVPTASTAATGIDGVTPFRAQLIWQVRDAAVPVTNGIDARLIEAEVKLAAGDTTGWLQTLNALRTGPTTDATLTIRNMPPLADPGVSPDPNARLKLMFRERAFWTFGRGQRLGDLRRMVRTYKMPVSAVFPGEGGVWFKTAAKYGTDYNIPVPGDELNNPNFHGCTDRAP